MDISEEKLKLLMSASAELGATKALINVGLLSPQIKLAQAYRIYGRTRIDNLIASGRFSKIDANTSNKNLDREELIRYFTTEIYAQ